MDMLFDNQQISASTLQNPVEVNILLFYKDATTFEIINQFEEYMKRILPHSSYLKVNITLYPRVMESFQVQEIPMAIFLQNGHEVWRRKIEAPDISLSSVNR